MTWTCDDPVESEAPVGTRRIAIGEGNCKGVEASGRQRARAKGDEKERGVCSDRVLELCECRRALKG
jgi:hypothetical protein